MGVGEYVYNIKGESEISYYNKKTDNYDKTEYFDIYQITARLPQEYGICPVCKKPVYNIKCFFADRGLDWDEFAVPKKYPQIDITRLCLQFRCPDHPKAVLKEDEGIVEFEVRDFRFKCFMENGQSIYMQIEQRKNYE